MKILLWNIKYIYIHFYVILSISNANTKAHDSLNVVWLNYANYFFLMRVKNICGGKFSLKNLAQRYRI